MWSGLRARDACASACVRVHVRGHARAYVRGRFDPGPRGHPGPAIDFKGEKCGPGSGTNPGPKLEAGQCEGEGDRKSHHFPPWASAKSRIGGPM